MRQRYDTVFDLLSAVSLAAVVIGVGVNGWFGWQAGHHTTIANINEFNFHWGYVLGGASIIFDLAKVLLPIIIVAAVFAKGRGWVHRGVVVFGCLAFWVPISVYSWSSAMGGAMLNRVDSASVRGHAVSEEERLRVEREVLKAKQPWTPEIAVYKDKPASALEEKISGQMKDPRWKNSDGCANPSRDERSFCQNLSVLKEAWVTAERAEQDAKRLAVIEERLSTFTSSGAADPQADVLAHTLNTTKEDAQEKWSKLFAGLLEGFGLLPALVYCARLLVDDVEPERKAAPASVPATIQPVTEPGPGLALSELSPTEVAEAVETEARVKKVAPPRRKKAAEPVPVRSDAAVATLLTSATAPASQEEVIDAVLDDVPPGKVKHAAIVQAVNEAASRWPDLAEVHPNKVTARLKARPGFKRLPAKKGERAVFYEFEQVAA